MSGQTYAYREKRMAVSAWLQDAYGGFVPERHRFNSHAEDFIKFMRANGFRIERDEEDE